MKITHDLHIHSYLSSCANESATVQHYLNTANELGLDKIGFSDHMWDATIDGANRWYQKQNLDHILQLKQELAEADSGDIKILFGCETEYDLPNKGVAIGEQTAKELDFVLVPNSHTHITMPKEYYDDYQKHADYMVSAFYDIMNSPVAKYITAIAHPFFAVGCPYDNRELFPLISNSTFEDCFKMAKANDIAMEINISSFKKKTLSQLYADPSLRMYHIAKECGCTFIIGADSHGSTGHDRFEIAYVLTSLLDITEDDFADIVK